MRTCADITRRIRRYRRAHGFPSRRHHCEAIDEQLWQSTLRKGINGQRPDADFELDYFGCAAQQRRIQGQGQYFDTYPLLLSLPWPGLCGGI
jgi:hypothetical protein